MSHPNFFFLLSVDHVLSSLQGSSSLTSCMHILGHAVSCSRESERDEIFGFKQNSAYLSDCDNTLGKLLIIEQSINSSEPA
jgi:hypothetical protein